MKKAILYLDGGFSVPVDIINYPPSLPRKENETWEEFEKRIADTFRKAQPNMVHKIVGIHIFRN